MSEVTETGNAPAALFHGQIHIHYLACDNGSLDLHRQDELHLHTPIHVIGLEGLLNYLSSMKST